MVVTRRAAAASSSTVAPTAPSPVRRWQWHFFDNNGSFDGWFDWVPLRLRVGYFSPIAVCLLIGLELSIFVYRPRVGLAVPPSTELYSRSHALDAAVCSWCLLVIFRCAIRRMLSGLLISFTGWSWFLLAIRALVATLRPFCMTGSAAASVLGSTEAYLRLPVLMGATITFCVWNVVLFPVIYTFAFQKDPTRRREFLVFNFGFGMSNFHIVNLPLAMVHTVIGDGVAKAFTGTDLWASFVVAGVYVLLYVFLLDRAGVHLYPIFSPRSHYCSISYGTLLALYFGVFHAWNALRARWDAHLELKG